LARIRWRTAPCCAGGSSPRKARVVSKTSGQKLFDAAGEPKEFWYEPSVGHGQFLKMMPGEFERRIVGFFDANIK